MEKINKWFAILFCSVLILFSAVNMVKPATAFSENENRYLAQWPQFTFSGLVDGSYTEKVEKYTTDQFLFRDAWVSMKANLEKAIGKKENNGVYFCKNGYLIEKMPEYNQQILDTNLKAIRELGLSGKYNTTFMLVPTAFEIEQEYLPANAYTDTQRRVLEYSRQQLQDSNVLFVDPTDYLSQHKDEYLYYRTDHHQTANGSFRTYEYLMNQMGLAPYSKEDFDVQTMSDEFLGTTWSKATIAVTPDEILKYQPKFEANYVVDYQDTGEFSESLYNEENLMIKDKYTYYLDGNHSILTINTGVKNGKSIAVFKDSYAHSILPFLANHYENIHVLDLRYYNFNSVEYLENNQITDVLVLYNVTNFMSDNNLAKLGAYLQ